MKLRAILIDDEKNCLTSLAYDIEQHCPEVEVVAQCQGSKEGLLSIKQHDPDLVFLDIDMPYINGFELLEMIPSIRFATIFTTAYDKYAVQAFKISAVDFLMKPINQKELINAVEKVAVHHSKQSAQKQISFLIEQIQAIESDSVKKIALPTFEGVEFVNLNDINYCQSDNNYTHVFLQDGTDLLISKTLRYIEEMLCDYHFFRVHNSYIVNLNYVKRYVKGDGGYLLLENGKDITVSRSKKAELLSMFG